MTGALVVNADDLGVSRGATLGIVKAHREGIVTSASMAVTTPFYAHALEVCTSMSPDLGLGLHFTLTSGRPVSPLRSVPLLVDGAGTFRWRFMPLLRAAALRRRSDLLDQVEIELEAQIQRLARDGVQADHIDSERHVHLIPGIFERVAAAARRHNIPFVRVGNEIGGLFSGSRHTVGLLTGGGFAKSWLLSALSRRARKCLDGAGKSRVRSADHFASYRYSGRLDLVLRQLLDEPPQSGVTEIMVHPGIPEESRGLVLGNPELERYLALEDRRKELDACIEARRWMTDVAMDAARSTVPGEAGRDAGGPGIGWRLTTFGSLAKAAMGC